LSTSILNIFNPEGFWREKRVAGKKGRGQAGQGGVEVGRGGKEKTLTVEFQFFCDAVEFEMEADGAKRNRRLSRRKTAREKVKRRQE